MRRSTRLFGLVPALVFTLAAASPGPERGDNGPLRNAFGTAVVISGDEAFIGRPGEFFIFPVPPGRPGAVDVFRLENGSWTLTSTAASNDVEVGDGFGTAIAVDGDILVVGAPKKDDGRGAAYVFERSGSDWNEVARLVSASATDGDAFGTAVAVSGERVTVGAPGRSSGAGAAVSFNRNGGAWTEATTLDAPDHPAAGRFGASVAMEGDLLAVGAPGTMPSLIPGVPSSPKPGVVTIYEATTTGYTQVGESAAEGPSPSLLGWVVKVEGGLVFATAPFGNAATGFVRVLGPNDSGDWEEVSSLVAATPAANSGFGLAFDVHGADAIVGAPLAQLAVAFEADVSGVWSDVGNTTDSSPMVFYGAGLGVGDGFAVVGAPGADFFEGTGDVITKNASGVWESVATLLHEGKPLEAVSGGEIECGEEGAIEEFTCSGVDMVSFLPLQDIGASRGDFTNDVWGWTDPDTGIEYAIVGKNDGTTFISLEDPTNPVFLGDLPLTEGAQANLWRDMKTYGNHVFVVADNAGAHGIQIFDLTTLRDVPDAPRTFEETAHYDGIFSAHNIVINEDTGFAYVVGASSGGETCGGALHMIDIRDPVNPIFAGCFSDPTTGLAGTGYSHDAQCILYNGPDEDHDGKEICFGANETALSIADVTDKANPIPISTAAYPNSAYAHQGWVSEDQRYFFMNDEGDEIAGTTPFTRTLVWDIVDLDDPILVNEHMGTTAATDHNLYVRDQFMYQSNYVSGLRVLDVSDAANPVEVGFFDTVPWGEDLPGFAGSFSNYPFFQSGVIIVSSMREGVFFLRKRPRPVF